MKYSYRITKYFKYTKQGFLADDGWSSFSDIDLNRVSQEEYLNIEQKYISAVILICQYLGVGYLQVSKLWNYNKKSRFRNKDLISLKDFPSFIQGILREEYWCKLIHPKCQFHFGYDFYMYCVSNTDLFELLTKNSQLHIEKFKSPYYKKNNL